MNIRKWKFRFGIVVIMISILIFFILFALPFLSMDVKTKLALTPVLLVAGEVMFWGGIVLIGKDVYLRFKEKLKDAWQTSKQDQLKKPSK
jgi:hypothetical protein